VGGSHRRKRLLVHTSVIERKQMRMKVFVQKTALLIMLPALLFGAASCSKHGGTGKPSNVDYYTCTMHPSVHSKDPGTCPICSMDLVPVMKGNATPASSSKNA